MIFFAEALGLRRSFWAFSGREEELPVGVLAELMDQDTKPAGGVTAAAGGLGRSESLDEIGAQGFVLAVSGVLGLEEGASESC